MSSHYSPGNSASFCRLLKDILLCFSTVEIIALCLFFFFFKKSSTYVPFLFSVSLWDKFSSSFSNHIVLSKKHLQVYNKKNDKVTCYISMYLLQLGLRRGRRVWTLSGKTSGGDRSCPSGLSSSQGVNTPTGLLTLISSSFFRHIVHLLLWDGVALDFTEISFLYCEDTSLKTQLYL